MIWKNKVFFFEKLSFFLLEHHIFRMQCMYDTLQDTNAAVKHIRLVYVYIEK